MGETRRHVAAQTSTPRSGDDRRCACAARRSPAAAVTTSNGSMRPSGQDAVREPVEDPPEVLVVHDREVAGTARLEDGLGPVGLRGRRRNGERQQLAGHEREQSRQRPAPASGEDQIRDEEQRCELDCRGEPRRHTERELSLPDPAFAEQIPHDQERHEQVDLTEADGDQDRVEEHGGETQGQRESPCRDAVEGRLDEAHGEDEHTDERHQVAHRPDRLHRPDAGERALPRCEEERGERGIGEREAGVREDEGVQVRREDVLPAEAQIDAQVDLVGPQRDVEAIGHRQRDRQEGRAPPIEPLPPRIEQAQLVALALQGLVDGCHESSRRCRVSHPLAIPPQGRETATGIPTRGCAAPIGPWAPPRLSPRPDLGPDDRGQLEGTLRGGTVVLGTVTGPPPTEPAVPDDFEAGLPGPCVRCSSTSSVPELAVVTKSADARAWRCSIPRR